MSTFRRVAARSAALAGFSEISGSDGEERRCQSLSLVLHPLVVTPPVAPVLERQASAVSFLHKVFDAVMGGDRIGSEEPLH